MRDQTNNSIRAHKTFKCTKLEENKILQLCLHDVCIFSNY